MTRGHAIFGILWLTGLVSLHAIPGTGALRTLFLLMGIGHVIALVRRSPAGEKPDGRAEAACLLALTLWLLVQSAFLSPTPVASLSALAGEWLKILLLIAMGVLLVSRAKRLGGTGWIAAGLFAGYFIHVVSTLAFQAWSLIRAGTLAVGESFLGNYGYVSPFVTGALAFLLAETVIRLRGRRWLAVSNHTLAIAFVATLAAQAVLAAKAGMVATVVLFLAVAIVISRVSGSWRWVTAFVAAALFAIAISLSVANRWQGALEAVSVAIDTPVTDFRSLGGPGEIVSGRSAIDVSFHDRAVWAKIGLAGIAAHPLGLGYGADAFGRFVAAQGGPQGAVSSHSGWIDFALANGIPGLLLLLALFFLVMRRGWRAFRAGNPAGLAAFLFVLNFALRSALDGHLAGSRLAGAVFVITVLWAMAASPAEKADAGHPD